MRIVSEKKGNGSVSADLSRGHLGDHEVVVFQRPPEDRSKDGPVRSTFLLPGPSGGGILKRPWSGPLAAEQALDVAHRREGQAAVGGDEEARRLELRKGCPARAESGLSAPPSLRSVTVPFEAVTRMSRSRPGA